MQVGLVGVEDAGQSGPLADEELVGGGGAGQAADGGAADLQFTGDAPQAHTFADEFVDGCVLPSDPVGQAP